MMSDTIEKLEQLLINKNTTVNSEEQNYVHAAVMMMLKETDRKYSMLFIKRPENEKDPFSGHMAFPGGRMESIDNGKDQTAVRETIEEVGIDIGKSGRILGSLEDVIPNNPRARNYIVTPYLSLLNEEVSMTLDPREVEKALWIPMAHLLDDKNTETRMRDRGDRMITDYVYYYDGYMIWGMTGRILHHFLSFSGHLF